MANAVRPLLRSSNERQTRLNFLPVSRDDGPQHGHAQRTTNNNNNITTPVATRRSSRSDPPSARPDHSSGGKEGRPTPARAHSSRKRPAAVLDHGDDDDDNDDADATNTRPPTKITVTRPHGELLRITNGVQAPLDMYADDVPSTSAPSTPRTGSSSEKLAAPSAAVPAPQSTASSQDKRSLRSHDGGSRLKSDLAVYFCNYDDIIAGVPKEAEFLQPDTPIYIVDEPLRPKSPLPVTPEPSPGTASPTRSRKARHSSPSPAPAPAQSSTTFRVFDYANAVHHDHGEDPLADAVYFTQHRRAERKEKQLRNIEKERAMHEKVQLERLLDGLQGPDWLKVMGITGVTDGERKDWEAKRTYFVKEVEALVDKFRVWKEEEKRLRAEKEAALAAREEDGDEDGEETEDTDSIIIHPRDSHHPHHPPPLRNHNLHNHPKDPDAPKPRRPPRPHGFLLPLLATEPLPPFQSFYTKPHLRAAALGKHRHGRNATAFGQPVPELAEREFELPHDFIDPSFLRDNARQRRRRKRESGVSGAVGQA
ncbi:hypothetical protein PTNB85_09241 [Pyrenophora teres f. teres]|uniref:SAS4 domain containing protein n=1 Tax=Pyrenophora teres f. teres TaxID=97479 RepID=A0A6S6VBI4_9PLEO|nr:hypothetical protein HRS9139_09913 [Pyrenophora teres f. teres]KAE8826296.1 hypothetical protein PTNB85_09241 [Pyrenophora teres f. teres]KAE8852644.1 hypothetical protein PTNB29_10034 [Pyrenophora teres f. teres]CAE7002511.1 SAS4 domain containing protein [Pyrenophora teres f. teres]